MYPMGYIHARNKLECMGLITEFRITTIILNGGVFQVSLLGFLAYFPLIMDREDINCYPCSRKSTTASSLLYDTYATLSLFTS